MFKKLAPVFSFVFFLLAFSFPAFAQEASDVPLASQAAAPAKQYPYMDILHPALKKFIEEGGTVSYMGNEHGMNAWVLEKGDNVQFSYTTPDGKGIIRGMLFGDSDKDLVTQKQVLRFRDLGEDRILEAFPPVLPDTQQAAAAPASKGAQQAQKFYETVEKSSFFTAGSKDAKPIYVFVDPTCEHCFNYWKELKPHADSGALQLRLIPIGWDRAGRNAAAALLSAEDPVKLWSDLAAGNKDALKGAKTDEAALSKVKANTDILVERRLRITPLTVYRNSEGRVVLIVDKPENLMLVVSDLTL